VDIVEVRGSSPLAPMRTGPAQTAVGGRAGRAGQRRRRYGAVAQLGERLDRTQEVRGSSPLSSTRFAGRYGNGGPGRHRSSVVEHSIRNRAVVGSSPTGGSAEPVAVYLGTPRLACGSSSVGRASASQAEGRGFEPRLPLWPAQDAGPRPAAGSRTGAPWCNWLHA